MDLITLAQINKLKKNGGVGYIEDTKAVCTATLEPIPGESVSIFEATDKYFALKAGETYTIILDSGTYTGVAKTFTDNVYIGNLAIGGDEGSVDTGESYLINDSANYCIAIDTNCGTSLEIRSTAETIHPIDPKFLPGVCLPVVELTTPDITHTDSGYPLNETDCAALDAAAEYRLPIVIKNFFGVLTTIADYSYQDAHLFLFSVGSYKDCGIGNMDGKWYIMIPDNL